MSGQICANLIADSTFSILANLTTQIWKFNCNDGSGASPRSIHRLQIVLILAIPVIESGFTIHISLLNMLKQSKHVQTSWADVKEKSQKPNEVAQIFEAARQAGLVSVEFTTNGGEEIVLQLKRWPRVQRRMGKYWSMWMCLQGRLELCSQNKFQWLIFFWTVYKTTTLRAESGAAWSWVLSTSCYFSVGGQDEARLSIPADISRPCCFRRIHIIPCPPWHRASQNERSGHFLTHGFG